MARGNLSRKQGKRPPNKRILIVTEGAIEKCYLIALKQHYRLTAVSIEIKTTKRTEPMQILDYAKEVFANKLWCFDEIYLVFDRDEHLTFDEALRMIAKTSLKNDERKHIRVMAIASIPCFELWILMHDTLVDANHPIRRQDVAQKITQYIQDYAKTTQFPLFDRTHANLSIAVQHAKKLADINTQTDHPKPFTAMHELIDLLGVLKL